MLDVVRISAIVAVVGIHCLAPAATAESAPWTLVVFRSMLNVAVPVFIMISGALNLAPVAMRNGAWPFLRSRFARLIPATIVWTLVYGVVINGVVLGRDLTPERLGKEALMGDQSPQLYFLWLIMGLSIITPVLGSFVAHSKARAWAATGVSLAWGLFVYLAPNAFEAVGQPTGVISGAVLTYWIFYVGHYLAGHVAFAHPVRRRLAPAVLALGIALLVALGVCGGLGIENEGWGKLVSGNYRSPLNVGASFALVAGLLAVSRGWEVSDRVKGVLRRLGDASFGVFLCHFVVLIGVRLLVPGLDSSGTLSCVGAWVLVLGLSWAVSLIAARIPCVRAVF